MSRYDFAVNEEELGTVCTNMKDKAEEIRTKINEIYSLIDGLSASWQSSAYDDFKNGCYKYKPGLEELANMIEFFGTTCDKFATESETLMTDVNSKFN